MEDGVSSTKLDPDSGERFVRLRRHLGVSTFGINQMLLQPGQRSRIHRHARQEEVYLVLEGELTLAIEGEEQTVGPGELVRVAPAVRRQLLNRGAVRCLMIGLGGAEPHDPRDGEAYASWEDTEPREPADVPWPEDLPIS